MGSLNLLGSVCSIVALGSVYLASPDEILARTFALSIGLLLMVSWVLLGVHFVRDHRRLRYGEALEDLHQAFHSLRDAWFRVDLEDSEDSIQHFVRDSLQSLATAFSIVTGVHCRVCVKELVLDRGTSDPMRALQTRTWCRSADGDARDDDSRPEWITENTDFIQLVREPGRRCFFSNNLLGEPGYRNSHWESGGAGNDERNYLSAIVWPIRKKHPGPRKHNGGFLASQDVIGYLCLDSRAVGVFDFDRDVPMGAAYADAFYIFFKDFKEHESQRTP
ncbi:MAG: hypothetical protein GHCLOJNM_03619 [bacterium]|nr:hypothetical protein [bacterium]